MKYAVLERTVPSENGTVETLYDAGEAGFDGIALQIDEPDPDSYLAWSAEGRAELRRVATDVNIEIMSIGTDFYSRGWEGGKGFLSNEESKRELAIEALEHSIDACGALGGDIVLISFFGPCEITGETDKQRVIDALNEVVATADFIDVTITLATSLPAAENAEIVDTVDSPMVKICYDAANKTALYGFDAITEVEVLGDRIGEYHVKDFHEPPPAFPDNYAALGKGVVDQQGVADALQAVGYEGWAMLETELDKPLEYTTDELAYTKELFGN